jgi:outer membrane receptor protein involved in Fe transport
MNKSICMLRWGQAVICAGLLLFMFASEMNVFQAQSTAARLAGIVKDERDAVIPGAAVRIINRGTGLQWDTVTSEGGYFTFPLLQPSTYSVTVKKTGFAPVQFEDVVLNVGDQKSLQVQLKAGDINAQVIINEDASTVRTNGSVGTVVDRQFISNIPLSQRSLQPLILLTPGVVPTHVGGINNGQFSVNGQRANANYITVDGVSANIGVSTSDVIGQQSAGSIPALTTAGGTNNLVSIDALQEFKIVTSTFAPEFGRTPGGQVTLVTRSGATEYHGTAFEYFRNDVFDANDWFSNRGGLKRAALRQNQFGATLSGPISWLRFGESPAMVGHSNKTFFFFSYEGQRLRQPQTAVTNVPSLRLRQLAPAAIQPIVKAIPLPTGPEVGTTGLAPLVANFSNPFTFDATSIRVDHNHSNRLLFFGRFNYAPSTTISRSRSLPNQIGTTSLDTTTLTAGSTMIFSPTTTNDLRFNYSRVPGRVSFSIDNFGGAVPFNTSLYLPSSVPANSELLTIVMTTQMTLGDIEDNSQQQYNVVDSLSLIRGNHTLKFGADYRKLMPIYNPRPYIQALFFQTQPSVTSAIASIVQVLGSQKVKPVFINFSAFAQDTWRATGRLTFTYGVRWELNPPPTEVDGKHPFVFTNLDNLANVQLAPTGTPLWKTTYNNFAPRAGIAYTLSQKPGRETVLRGGFGVFYDLGNGQAADAFASPPFKSITSFFTNIPVPITPAQAAVPPYPTDARSSILLAYDPHLKLPYTLQWNATIEQSLGENQTFSAAYVAALGRRQLHSNLFLNPNPNVMGYSLINNDATSSYHSMQLQFNRRLARGLQALASYTWSHAIDDSSIESQDQIQDRGDADFDIRHAFSAALTYDLPLPSKSKAASLFLRGWAFDTIVHALSASPFTPTGGQVVINAQVFRVRPDRIQGQPVYLNDPTAPGGKRINPAAFSTPAVGFRGTAGRNSLRAFPLYQFDVAIHRRFKFGDRAFAELRAEAFNVFNHPNFGTPDPDIRNTTFGFSTQMLNRDLAGVSPIYQIGGPRSLQFALRLGF